jgi:molybdopterin molybdotransferase
MISLSDAQSRLLSLAKPLPTEMLPLNQSVGRWLADDLIARRTQPARDLSAMDGYALSSRPPTDHWHVVGESAAGAPFAEPVQGCDAVRIFTGAALPEGADCVIIQENVIRDGAEIRIANDLRPIPGQHVRVRGSDFVEGQVLISAGTRLDPGKIALAAMAGYDSIAVHRRVRVAIVSSGDELVAPGAPCDNDHIPASNAVMIEAMMSNFPVEFCDCGIIPDDLASLTSAIQAARCHDVIVTSGGASVGDHDLIRPALIAAGASIDFWKVAMRPGKPVMAGTLGDALVLGLPGNPVSAFVTALLFLIPVVSALAGARDPMPRISYAPLGEPLPAVGSRTDHLRACLSPSGVVRTGADDSAALKGLAMADALIVREANSGPANPGDLVPIILLS